MHILFLLNRSASDSDAEAAAFNCSNCIGLHQPDACKALPHAMHIPQDGVSTVFRCSAH